MHQPLTSQYLDQLLKKVDNQPTPAFNDAALDRIAISTPLFRALIDAARQGLQGQELARVTHTVIHLADSGVLTLDPDTLSDLVALLPFSPFVTERHRLLDEMTSSAQDLPGGYH